MAKSHSQERQVALRYASALFSLAKEQSVVAQVAEELSALYHALADSKEFEQLCHSPALSTEQKIEILYALTQRIGVSALVADFLRVLVQNNRLPVLGLVAEEYASLHRIEVGEAIVVVTSADALDANTTKDMEVQLGKALQKQVIIENKIDASLIGGVTIRYGSLELDASVKGKLAKAAERLYEGIANAA